MLISMIHRCRRILHRLAATLCLRVGRHDRSGTGGPGIVPTDRSRSRPQVGSHGPGSDLTYLNIEIVHPGVTLVRDELHADSQRLVGDVALMTLESDQRLRRRLDPQMNPIRNVEICRPAGLLNKAHSVTRHAFGRQLLSDGRVQGNGDTPLRLHHPADRGRSLTMSSAAVTSTEPLSNELDSITRAAVPPARSCETISWASAASTAFATSWVCLPKR